MTQDERIGKALGERIAALFSRAESDAPAAFASAGSVQGVVTRFRMDLIRTGKVDF